jgi:predicted nucleotidyltransferase
VKLDRVAIVNTVCAAFPETQAVYLFGSFVTGDIWPSSDVDIALLLPPEQAKAAGELQLSDLRGGLERLLQRDVDLINLRRVTTVLQKEIAINGERLACADRYAADEFEMHVLSLYVKLNEERAGVLEEGLRSGRFYKV